ncbi:MAG: hypothetical protein ABSA46_10405 [Thermodesulfovibrionales bacterium]|jgi:hypothetical protein
MIPVATHPLSFHETCPESAHPWIHCWDFDNCDNKGLDLDGSCREHFVGKELVSQVQCPVRTGIITQINVFIS